MTPTRVQHGELNGSVWESATRPPRPALAPHVLRIAGYDECAPGPRSQRQFPEAFVVVIVEFGPPLRVALGGDASSAARHEGGFVAALGEDFAICEHSGRQRGVQIDLTPTGARRLLGVPLSELTGYVVGLRELWPVEVALLAERLDEARDWAHRLDLVETFLEQRILGAVLDSARVDRAIARITATRGNLTVSSLASELQISRKHLVTLFHDQVGVAPKLHARLVRFAGLMRATQRGGEGPWTDLALAHGFYDQAHLVREVRHFTGLTPTSARAHLSAELAELFG